MWWFRRERKRYVSKNDCSQQRSCSFNGRGRILEAINEKPNLLFTSFRSNCERWRKQVRLSSGDFRTRQLSSEWAFAVGSTKITQADRTTTDSTTTTSSLFPITHTSQPWTTTAANNHLFWPPLQRLRHLVCFNKWAWLEALLWLLFHLCILSM